MHYEGESDMEIDRDKVDDAVLALLYLTRFYEKGPGVMCTWKGHDWNALDRLHEKEYISNPKSKAKSVVFTAEGFARSEELFKELFRLVDEPEADS
ncbi:MAG: hypothetical protein KC435_12780 [Thermomicrobiales bacterium]|nr:hypothetical protein [Thermomicrobiales bacterium]